MAELPIIGFGEVSRYLLKFFFLFLLWVTPWLYDSLLNDFMDVE
jgi:hypothetical protein